MSTRKTLAMLPWFPANFLSATRGWSVTAKGVYRELLDAQWELGLLPADPVELRRMIGATEQEWADGWARCSSKFAPVGGGIRNERLEEHRSESQRLKAARAAAAERTNARLGRGRRDGERYADRHADRVAQRDGDRPKETVSDTPSETLTDTSTSTLFSSTSAPRVFEDSDSRPQKRTRERPAYEAEEFHQQVIEAYHKLCPELPRVKRWSKTRAAHLNARIRESLKLGKAADTVEYWRKFFSSVAGSDFLSGRKGSWRASLSWLLKSEETFSRVIEGNYADPGGHGGGSHLPFADIGRNRVLPDAYDVGADRPRPPRKFLA